MASNKFYSYYLRGSQIALIEQDIDDNSRWKSPASTVADGLEIEYAYSPRYTFHTTTSLDQNLTQYKATDGTDGNSYLTVRDSTSSYTSYSSTVAPGEYIVLRNAGRFNGLHKVDSRITDGASDNGFITFTKYQGSSAWTDFEETVDLYYDVNVLNDETDTIDLPEYLAKGLVYYVKAKIAEDRMDIEAKEYFMMEFRKMVEKQESSKIWGGRLITPASNAIR